MTVWDALTWATVMMLGPGVIVICIAVARDLRRLLGDAPPLPEHAAPDEREAAPGRGAGAHGASPPS